MARSLATRALLACLYTAAVFGLAEAVAHTFHPFETPAASGDSLFTPAQPVTALDAGGDAGRTR